MFLCLHTLSKDSPRVASEGEGMGVTLPLTASHAHAEAAVRPLAAHPRVDAHARASGRHHRHQPSCLVVFVHVGQTAWGRREGREEEDW